MSFKLPQGTGVVSWLPPRMELITPDDDNDLSEPSMIYVSANGDVEYMPALGSNTITLSFAAGEVVPCIVRRVLEDTTATVYRCF